MLRINNIEQIHAQRTLRANYAQTQATAHNAYLSGTTQAGAAFVRGSGSVPGQAGQGPIFAGQVAAWSASAENVHVSVGAQIFAPAGLFGNNIGGDFDELYGSDECVVWHGVGSVWEILSPVFNANITDADEATAADRLLYPDANGLLNDTAVGGGPAVAQLQQWVSASKIIVMLKV